MVSSLEELLNPVSVENFKKDYFEKQYCFIKNKLGETFDSGFTLEVFERILWEHETMLYNNLVVNIKGKYIPVPGRGSGKDIFMWALDQYHMGATLILNGIHNIFKPIVGITRSLDQYFNGVATANVYLTPPNSQGFLPHFDAHDVFIYQTAGCKKWKIYDNRLDFPTFNQIFPLDQNTVGEPVFDDCLYANDVLYIPKGHVHGSFTENDYSLHITLGIRPLRWMKFLETMVDIIGENESGFRESIHAGASFDEDFDTILDKFLSYARDSEIRKLTLEKCKESHISQLRPAPFNSFKTAAQGASITEHTQFINRYSGLAHIVERKGKLHVLFPGKGMPDKKNPPSGNIETLIMFKPYIEQIVASNSAFTLADFGTELNNDIKKKILFKFWHDGLLAIM